MAQANGEQFGRYELVSRIGRGGMAETWYARLVGAAGVTKPVLIKKVLPEFANDDAFVSMFISEARISATLSHGSIAQVFDFGQVDGEYFLAMEFVDGQPLHRVMKRALRSGFACLPVHIAAFIGLEMCRGLHYAHTRTDSDGAPLGIVHRDISPDNVLLSYEGQVKIVDFGIAKARSLRSFDTAPGVVKGKYLFFSPEQARGEEVDARTDVWATAVVLFEMVCGKPPIEGPEYVVMHRLTNGEPMPRARNVRPDVPTQLDHILMKALAISKEERFESAHAFGDALAGFLYTSMPRFSSMSVAYLLRELFKQDMTQVGRDTKVPPSFIEELSVWRAAPPMPASTQPALQTLVQEPKTQEHEAVDGDGEGGSQSIDVNDDTPLLRVSSFHLVIAATVIGLLLLVGIPFFRAWSASTPEEQVVEEKSPVTPVDTGPGRLKEYAEQPPAQPPRDEKPVVQAEVASSATWPVDTFVLDARKHVLRVSSGAAALSDLGLEPGLRIAETPLSSGSRTQMTPPLFYMLQGKDVTAAQSVGAVTRKAEELPRAMTLMLFTLGAPLTSENLPTREVRVTNSRTNTSRRIDVHPEWMTATLDRAFVLKGLDAGSMYRLSLEPVGEGAFTRGRERGPANAVACVQWIGADERPPIHPARAQRFLLSLGEEVHFSGMHGLQCGYLDDDLSDNEGALSVRIGKMGPVTRNVTINGRSEQAERGPTVQHTRQSASASVSDPNEPRLLSEARTLLQRRNYREAAARARACLEQLPNQEDCHLVLASALAKLNNARDAAVHYQKFLELAPRDHPRASEVLQLLDNVQQDP